MSTDDPDAPQITEVKRLTIQPGDVLILETDGTWNIPDCQRAEAYLRAKFPHNEVVIIHGGTLKVSTALPAPAEAASPE